MEGLESFFTVSQQLKLFLLSCLFGIPTGIVFDIFRALRVIFPHGKAAVALEDILFFVLYGIFIMAFSSAAARSEFRFYYCIGNLLGFLIYHFTVGSVAVMIIRKLAEAIKKVFYLIFSPINKKIALLFKKIRTFFVESRQKHETNKKNS